MKVAIIGGGAAGYFAAINLREMTRKCEVTIFEGGSHSLAKVAVSGGGRCNLTNTFAGVDSLTSVYPRGSKLLKRLFKIFDHHATVEWFEQRGVRLVAQADECVFPVSQSAQEIVTTLTSLAAQSGVEVKHSHRIERITPTDGGGYSLHFADAKLSDRAFDVVVVTTGGSPKIEGFDMLSGVEVAIVPPVPSLFTFNIPNDPITTLMGSVVEGVEVSIVGSKLSARGDLLITHWGMSGPAILRLSSYAARLLHDSNYRAKVSVNWVGERNTERVAEALRSHIAEHGAKLVTSRSPFSLPSRVWCALLERCDISPARRFAELGSKGINRLVERLTHDEYAIEGQSRFREEFVTCGGVALSELDMQSCRSRRYEGLYFAGEVVDVDAVTGGFNLQAAWSMGYCVARGIASTLE